MAKAKSIIIAVICLGVFLVIAGAMRPVVKKEAQTNIERSVHRPTARDIIKKDVLREANLALRQDRPERARRLSETAEVFYDQAKDFLKNGMDAQARLSLFAALQKDPMDFKAASLLLKMEKGAGPAAAENKDSSDVSLEFTNEGITLFENGDIIGAKRILEKAKEAVDPNIASVHVAALRSALAKVDGAIYSRIEELETRFSESEGALDPKRIGMLKDIKKSSDEILNVFPNDARIASVRKETLSALGAIAAKCLAAAEMAERFGGCAKAAPMFKEIAELFREVDGSAVLEAEEGLKRCTK